MKRILVLLFAVTLLCGGPVMLKCFAVLNPGELGLEDELVIPPETSDPEDTVDGPQMCEKHKFGSWVIITPPSCFVDGLRGIECSVCGYAETEVIKAEGHKWMVWELEKAATPESYGLQTEKCINCDETKFEYVEYYFEELQDKAKKQHPFKDVKDSAWYNSVVNNCYHYGLMVGTTETTFNPSGNITRAEVITSAVRIYCLYNPDDEKPELGTSPWYKGYVDYAIEKGIIKQDDFTDYTVPATRAEMAYVFANIVSEENLEKINDVTFIPDVKDGDKYAKEIFLLYNAGVLTGNDDIGTFAPQNEITRAESAAIIARISKISNRVKK